MAKLENVKSLIKSKEIQKENEEEKQTKQNQLLDEEIDFLNTQAWRLEAK